MRRLGPLVAGELPGGDLVFAAALLLTILAIAALVLFLSAGFDRFLLWLGVRNKTTRCTHGYRLRSSECVQCHARLTLSFYEWNRYSRDVEALLRSDHAVIRKAGEWPHVFRSRDGYEIQVLLPSEIAHLALGDGWRVPR